MQETRVQSLGQEDPLKEEMATHSSIIAWSGGAWRATVHGAQRVGHDLAHTHCCLRIYLCLWRLRCWCVSYRKLVYLMHNKAKLKHWNLEQSKTYCRAR